MNEWFKDPADRLDYTADWSSWLAPGETIASCTATTSTGLTIDSYSAQGGLLTVWLSGGTAGGRHEVVMSITTSQGRQGTTRHFVIVQGRFD